MLNSIPLFTSILGVLFLLMILVNGGALKNNKPAWITLIIIVLFAIHSQLDAYLFYNGHEGSWIGLSLLHYHLMGGLFLYFGYKLFRIDINLRLWTVVLLIYSVLRVLFLIPEDSSLYENYSGDLGWVDAGIVLDSFMSNGLNITTLLVTFSRVKKLNFTVKLSEAGKLNYLWLKNLIRFQTGIYFVIVLITIISFFYAEEWLTFWKLESMISGFFFFVLAFFAIRFPVFSIYGDFKDLQEEEKKYAKSSLTKESSADIWKEIDFIMNEEKLYRDPEYRLNDLAERVGKSVHHVSQAINEQNGGSFSDFLNTFRIEETLNLLKSDRAKDITILAIAFEAGFNSKTTFYNAFKKVTGKTPSVFLKELKQLSETTR